LTSRFGRPKEVIDQPEGLLVHPLEVVNAEREWTERRERPMRRLEDPQRLTTLFIVASKHEPFEARTMDRNRRQLADELADGGQGHGLVGFKSDNADESRGPGTGQDLREKPGLSAAGISRHNCGARRSIVARAAYQPRERIELLLTADERRAHAAKGTPRRCRPDWPRVTRQALAEVDEDLAGGALAGPPASTDALYRRPTIGPDGDGVTSRPW
jgi:hypothetical protein